MKSTARKLRKACWILVCVSFALEPSSRAETTKILATRLEIPERGDVPGYLLIQGTNRFRFMSPAGWKPEGRLDRREVIFISAELDASLTFKVLDGAKPASLEETRRRVQEQVSNSKLLHEFPCYAVGRVGMGFEFEQMGAEKARVNVRYGVIPLPAGMAECILRAPSGRIRDLELVFGQFLASLQTDTRSARK